VTSCEVKGLVNRADTAFLGPSDFRKAEFCGSVAFGDARFGGKLNVARAKFFRSKSIY
jgi:hypothetical protein